MPDLRSVKHLLAGCNGELLEALALGTGDKKCGLQEWIHRRGVRARMFEGRKHRRQMLDSVGHECQGCCENPRVENGPEMPTRVRRRCMELVVPQNLGVNACARTK